MLKSDDQPLVRLQVYDWTILIRVQSLESSDSDTSIGTVGLNTNFMNIYYIYICITQGTDRYCMHMYYYYVRGIINLYIHKVMADTQCNDRYFMHMYYYVRGIMYVAVAAALADVHKWRS